MNSGVYVIRCLVTMKEYIGSSNNINHRLSAHRSHLRAGTHQNPHLQRAWDKYGEDNFTFSSVFYCDSDDVLNEEQKILDFMFKLVGTRMDCSILPRIPRRFAQVFQIRLNNEQRFLRQ
jgi:group I intron endonuclease